jgi:hypothetical protein
MQAPRAFLIAGVRARALGFLVSALALLTLGATAPSRSKPDAKKSAVSTDPFDQSRLGGLMWRNIGPYRGGRVTAVTGVVGQRNVFYFGGTGSGLWKSVNSGLTWTNVADGQLGTGSVGAVAVAPSDPNVVYAGMGEGCIRGNVSRGDGVYSSVDGGRT